MKQISCKKIKREVPRTQMQQGIDKCKANVLDYIMDARLIAKEGRFNHAVISLEYALEEFGKALLLQETIVNSTSDLIAINGGEFCNHERKVQRALKLLDPGHKYRILFESFVVRGVFEAGMLEGETAIGDSTRMDCAFVDYLNNSWTIGRNIKPEFFDDLLNLTEKGLASLKTS